MCSSMNMILRPSSFKNIASQNAYTKQTDLTTKFPLINTYRIHGGNGTQIQYLTKTNLKKKIFVPFILSLHTQTT